MKRILTIQDISCLGKCSLTIALPTLSAMGLETVILPTALLSTHTMFKNYTVKDLTDQLLPIARHWESENVRFDAIYTGYLGSAEEIDIVKEIFSMFRAEDTLVFVDPVMGDNGKLYPAFNMDYASLNADLCAAADLIAPNITEACFMTGVEYRETYDETYVTDLLQKLSALGAKVSLLTGVSLSPGKTGVMGYDSRSQTCFRYQNDLVNARYHGTGDLFSSALVGAVLNGATLEAAARIAADYTAHTIRVTLENPEKPWYGVDFERTLPELIRSLRQETE